MIDLVLHPAHMEELVNTYIHAIFLFGYRGIVQSNNNKWLYNKTRLILIKKNNKIR